MDAAGNAVSVTYMLNDLSGNGVTATGTGILFNNEMDDLAAKVGVKNRFGLLQSEANAIHHEPFFTSTDTMDLLRAKGHTLATRKLYPNDPEASARTWGDAESILIDPATGIRLGANDSRSPDSAAVAAPLAAPGR